MWDALSTPTIDKHIHLSNLKALFMILKGEDPLANQQDSDRILAISPKYKVGLTDAHKKLVGDSLKLNEEMYRTVVLPALKEYLLMLASNDYPLENTIKAELTGAFYFGEEHLMTDFPDDPTLTIQYSHSLYQLLEMSLAQ